MQNKKVNADHDVLKCVLACARIGARACVRAHLLPLIQGPSSHFGHLRFPGSPLAHHALTTVTVQLFDSATLRALSQNNSGNNSTQQINCLRCSVTRPVSFLMLPSLSQPPAPEPRCRGTGGHSCITPCHMLHCEGRFGRERECGRLNIHRSREHGVGNARRCRSLEFYRRSLCTLALGIGRDIWWLVFFFWLERSSFDMLLVVMPHSATSSASGDEISTMSI